MYEYMYGANWHESYTDVVYHSLLLGAQSLGAGVLDLVLRPALSLDLVIKASAHG
jgi:hypothetical protein